MKLREMIYNEAKKIKTDIDAESLSAIATYYISQNDYFKSTYSHFNMITNGKDFRIFSPETNNTYGLDNRKLSKMIIDSNPKNYYGFSSNISINGDEDEEKQDIILLDNYKFDCIKKYFKFISNSNNFNELSKFIKTEHENNPSFLFVLKQNLSYQFKYKFNIIDDFFNLALNLTNIEDLDKTYYQIELFKIDKISIGSTYSRDLFRDSTTERLINIKYKEKQIEYIDNRMDLNSLTKLFTDDSTNQTPTEIIELLNNKNIKNSDLLSFFIGNNSKYSNKKIEIIFSEDSQDDKIINFSNIYFTELKEKFLEKSKDVFSYFKPIENILEKYNSSILQIEKNINLNLENQKITINKFYYYKDKDYNEDEEHFSILENFEKLDFYENSYHNFPAKGLCFCSRNSFNGLDNDNILITINNENELVGFFSAYINDRFLNINNINISSHHRGKGLSKILIKEIIDLSIEKDLILVSTMYTKQGEKNLPFIKKKLSLENPNFLWIDNNINFNGQEKHESLTSDVNSCLIQYIKEGDYKNISVKQFRKIYDNCNNIVKNEINNSDSDSWDFYYSLKNKYIKNFKEELNSLNIKKTNKLKI